MPELFPFERIVYVELRLGFSDIYFNYFSFLPLISYDARLCLTLAREQLKYLESESEFRKLNNVFLAVNWQNRMNCEHHSHRFR